MTDIEITLIFTLVCFIVLDILAGIHIKILRTGVKSLVQENLELKNSLLQIIKTDEAHNCRLIAAQTLHKGKKDVVS